MEGCGENVREVVDKGGGSLGKEAVYGESAEKLEGVCSHGGITFLGGGFIFSGGGFDALVLGS